jgi:hypothetical protein
MPHQVKQLVLRDELPTIAEPDTGPRVVVSIDSFNPIQPAHAYDDLIREAAAKYDLEPALIRSVIRMESGFDPFAVSRVGAMGLMQLMPAVAEEMGVKTRSTRGRTSWAARASSEICWSATRATSR